MKRKTIYILMILLVVVGLSATIILLTFDKRNNKTDNNPSVKNEVIQETELQFTGNIVGKIKIPKIEVEAEISEGTDLDTLAEYVGHFKNTSLWDGNVALAAHNRNSNGAHYFEGIHLLEDGDEVIYITNMGERRYTVFNKKEISDTDWSVTTETKDNILTLVTCITGYPDKRLCVQAKEF